MSNKPIIIVSSIAVAALFIGVGVWFFSRDGSEVRKPDVSVIEQTQQNQVLAPEARVCPELSSEQRTVEVSLKDVTQPTDGAKRLYQVSVESKYLVNVVKIVLGYAPNDLAFDRVNGDESVFPIEAPESHAPGEIVATRGIVGKDGGLLGVGEFATFEFTNVRKSKQGSVATPTIDIEKSVAYVNDGCATRGTLVIRNQ